MVQETSDPSSNDATVTRRSSSRLHRVSIENVINLESSRPITKQLDERKPTRSRNSNSRNMSKYDNEATNAATTIAVVVEFDGVVANGDAADDVEVYPFDGVNYTSYQDMVNAKRRRNQEVLEKSGLLSTTAMLRSSSRQSVATESRNSATISKRGIQSAKRPSKKELLLLDPTNTSTDYITNTSAKRRKSSRLLGIESDGLYIEEERSGQVTVAGIGDKTTTTTGTITTTHGSNNSNSDKYYYSNRINDGSSVSITEAIEYAGSKWMTDTSVADATAFVRNTLATATDDTASLTTTVSTTPTKSRETSMTINDGNRYRYDSSMVAALDGTDMERNVAKLCPDRIYSMAVHPSRTNLIVCAGDKSGHVGIWNVNHHIENTTDPIEFATQKDVTTTTTTTTTTSSSNDRNGVHLFKPHAGTVCCLQWTGSSSSSATTGSSNSNSLVSASYDGTIRMLDVHREEFIETFATYNSEDRYRDQFGYGIENGSKFWTQHVCLDPRYNESTCFFLSTSVGTAMHIDLRDKNHITLHAELSEKKINTLSIHPNGYSLISGGLDGNVALWDVRKLGNSLQPQRGRKNGLPERIAYYNCGRSINSVYFSPSGKYAVSTTMQNKLDIFEDLHLSNNDGQGKKSGNDKNGVMIQPKNSVRHDNITGRWLTTFQAIFHPQLDLFVVGSMRQPRCIELFDPSPTDKHKNDHGTLLRTVQGDAFTSVASRLAFHPRTDQLIVCGGNASGRVTIVR